MGTCGTCVYGDCVAGFCQCADTWDGPQCDVPAKCDKVNECTDQNHGTCVKNNKCQCVEGFTGMSDRKHEEYVYSVKYVP